MKYKFKGLNSKFRIDILSHFAQKIFPIFFLLVMLSIFDFIPSVSADVFDYRLVASQPGFYNVKTMGAKGDGVTDDTAAINNAIAQTLYPNGGGVVYLPEGKYLVTGLNARYLNGTTITGDGPDKTFVISAGFAGPVLDTLGSNYLTIAKLSIGLRDNATADTGITMGNAPPPNEASATANSIDQVTIEDTGVNSSFNIANFLMLSFDTHITDSKFISRNRATTPAVMTGGGTDNTFINVLIRKETAGNVGAFASKGGEERFFNSRIESADPNGVVVSNSVTGSVFYNTLIMPINQTQFSDACIKLPSPQTPIIQVHGLTFDPPNCSSAVGPLRFGDQNWIFRVLYPPQGFTRDIRGDRDIPLNNVPRFYVADAPFPSAPPTFNSPSPTSQSSASPSPSGSGSRKLGDVDRDGDLDIQDYSLIVQYFDRKDLTTPQIEMADLDDDGTVDIDDYNEVVQAFRQSLN